MPRKKKPEPPPDIRDLPDVKPPYSEPLKIFLKRTKACVRGYEIVNALFRCQNGAPSTERVMKLVSKEWLEYSARMISDDDPDWLYRIVNKSYNASKAIAGQPQSYRKTEDDYRPWGGKNVGTNRLESTTWGAK